jgi:hypothetical protein
MIPTPRTDAYKGTHETHRNNGKTIYGHAEELERELAEARESIKEHDACADAWCAKARKLNEGLAEAIRERDNAESDKRQADVDTLRALHERNEARAQRDRLADALRGLREVIHDTRGPDAFHAVKNADQVLAANAKELSTLPTEKGSPVGDETSEPETHQPEMAVDLSGVPGSVGNILIRKSPTADTRTCDFANVSKGTLLQSSHQHINDVRNGLLFFTAYMENAARNHDWDKIAFIDDFHADFVTGFDKASWWFNHRHISRHHLAHEDGIPKDVNLLDVLEYIVDCVMAGMARSGDVYELKMSPELMKVAFNNTINLLKSKVEVIEE